MPITPLDMLTLVPRTNEVSAIKHVEAQRPMEEQMQMNTTFQQTVKHEQRKTIESKKSENNEYRYDAKEKGNGQSYNGQNKKGKKKEDTLHSVPGYEKGSFDIKI